ncbi:MAG: 5-formyltetrahydrofolate cyclo-ligase [Clostridiales bacterium]|jgi:5-formyltetrahydrofolate cyclo-ligase|nr:5-formyltetrahydrofolate cyclo-ligase [Clostridiales bacterium]
MNETMTIAEKKAALRSVLRKKARDLPATEARISSEAICRSVIQWLPEYKDSGTLFVFVGTKMEINTDSIIEHALAAGKTVGVPLCVSPGVMEVRSITGFRDLEPGAYGILEPKKERPIISPGDIDLAIVPCISCDKKRRRLGQGGGFYDRFMAKGNFPKIALCRADFLLEEVPVEQWDLPVDGVVTETEII